MKVLLTHPGTQYSYYLAKQLRRHGLLFQFHTGFAFGENSWKKKLVDRLPKRFRIRLQNRCVAGVPDDLIHSHWPTTLYFLVAHYLVKNKEHAFHVRNSIFQKSISDAAIRAADVVIGFDTSSWLLADRCKKLGKLFILDVSIGHPLAKEKIYARLRQRYASWGTDAAPKAQYLIDVECQEIECADRIVVPSNFVRQTYLENGVSADKIKINPFGTNVSDFVAKPKRVSKDDNVVFLFFGSFTARKGLPLLLAAWRELNTTRTELILAGYGTLPPEVVLPANVTNKGAIVRSQRQSLFDCAHVFVFPSNFEGLAQVQIEAAACGLPLIGTYNSGGGELIEDNKNGFLIEAEDKESLKKSIQYFVNHPEEINEMGQFSRKIAERFSWDSYGDRWRNIINNELVFTVSEKQ